MKILVIGGTRFLGRHIVSDLARRGHEVVVANRGRGRPHPQATRAIPCDKNDREVFGRVLRQEPWDAVLDTILDDADLKFAVEALKGRVGHFIHTGSIGVYAPPRLIPSRESDPLAEHDAVFNFNTKLRQEHVLQRAHLEHRFPATTLRMSMIYGAGDIPLDGWGGRRKEFFHMLRDGATIPLPHAGLALLHPGDVSDLARAFGEALEQPRSIGQAYNIAGSRALAMRDYVAALAAVMGVAPRLEFTTPEEILRRFPQWTTERGLLLSCEHMCCDIAKAERDLGWKPVAPLEVGFAENIAWMRQEGRL